MTPAHCRPDAHPEGSVSVRHTCAVVAGHVPAPAAASRGGARRPSRHAREGPRDLADLDLVAGRRRSARAGLRAGGAGLQARDESRDHRRQPPAPVLGDGRGAVAGRRSGSAVPGRRGRGNGLRAERRRHPVRHRRGPGAGRQAARDPRPLPEARAHHLRRSARAAPLHAGFPARLRRHPGAGPRASRSAPGFLPAARWPRAGPTTSRS